MDVQDRCSAPTISCKCLGTRLSLRRLVSNHVLLRPLLAPVSYLNPRLSIWVCSLISELQVVVEVVEDRLRIMDLIRDLGAVDVEDAGSSSVV